MCEYGPCIPDIHVRTKTPLYPKTTRRADISRTADNYSAVPAIVANTAFNKHVSKGAISSYIIINLTIEEAWSVVSVRM